MKQSKSQVKTVKHMNRATKNNRQFVKSYLRSEVIKRTNSTKRY